MRLFYTTIWFLFFAIQLSAQCPTGDVILANQESIDAFATDYPDCTEISGDLILGGLGDIIAVPLDLSQLSNLTSVEGTLEIRHTESYDPDTEEYGPGSLLGLENITSVKNLKVGRQTFDGSPAGPRSFLQDLEPLNGISGNVDTLWLGNFVSTNSDMPDFPNIHTIDYFKQDGVAGISTTPSFPSLTSIRDFTVHGSAYQIDSVLTTIIIPNNLTTVAGPSPLYAGFYISQNFALVEIVGGENLTNIEGEVYINNNRQLSSISGLDNIQNVNYIFIQANKSPAFDALKNLESVHSLNLQFNTEPIDFQYDELSDSVVFRIGENVDNLLVNQLHYTAYNVREVFQPGNVKSVESLSIQADSATSFSGFHMLDSIGSQNLGNLGMNIPNLTQLPDFSSLTYIGGNLQISFGNIGYDQPGQLVNLDGLNALERVGQFWILGGSSVENNLVSLAGLENLDSISGGLRLIHLTSLTDLSALSTDLFFGGSLRISNNNSLESCGESPVFCNLISQASNVIIQNNGSGCNDVDSIQSICTTGIDEVNSAILNAWFGYSDQLNVSLDNNSNPYEIRLFNILGQEVFYSQGSYGSGILTLELNKTLKTGIYILEYRSETVRETRSLPFIE